jgi:hypothetical protein
MAHYTSAEFVQAVTQPGAGADLFELADAIRLSGVVRLIPCPSLPTLGGTQERVRGAHAPLLPAGRGAMVGASASASPSACGEGTAQGCFAPACGEKAGGEVQGGKKILVAVVGSPPLRCSVADGL